MYLLNQSFDLSRVKEVSLLKKEAQQRVKIRVRWTSEMEDQLVDWQQQHKCL